MSILCHAPHAIPPHAEEKLRNSHKINLGKSLGKGLRENATFWTMTGVDMLMDVDGRRPSMARKVQPSTVDCERQPVNKKDANFEIMIRFF